MHVDKFYARNKSMIFSKRNAFLLSRFSFLNVMLVYSLIFEFLCNIYMEIYRCIFALNTYIDYIANVLFTKIEMYSSMHKMQKTTSS